MAIDINSIPGTPANTGSLADVSQFGSFGRGAASMLPLGKQAYSGVASLAEHKPYTQERGELEQELKQDVEQAPAAHYAGMAAGVAAPIVATAGLAAPETLLGAAGQGALFGGAFGAGNAVDTLAGGGSGADAAKDVAVGAGLGAAGGAAGEAVGSLLGKGAEAVAGSKIGQRLQSENISKALGFSPGAIKALAVREGETPEATVLGAWNDIKGIPNLPEGFVTPTSNVNEKLAILKPLHDRAGQDIGAQLKSAATATSGNFPEGMQAAKDLATQAEGYVGIPDGSQEAMKAIAAQIQAAENAGKLDFEQLARIRTAVGDQVRRDVPGSSQIYRTLSQNLDKAMDRIEGAPGIDKGAFQGARKTYAVTSKIMPLMERGAAREASGTGGGLSNLLGIGGTLMGHPAAAVAPVAHEIQKVAAPQMIHNIMLGGTGAGAAIAGGLPKAAAQIAASQAPKPETPTDVLLDHPALAKYRRPFAQAAAQAKTPAEAQTSEARTAFTLSQTDPGFTKAQEEAAKTPNQTNKPQNMADGGIVPAKKVYGSAKPKEPFNSQMADQLQAYLMRAKDKQ